MAKRKDQEFEEDTYGDEKFEDIDRTERSESRHRGGRLLLAVGLTVFIVAAVGVIAYSLFVGNEEEEEAVLPDILTVTEPEEEPEEETEEEEDSGYIMPDAGYIGYWNRKNHEDEELTIAEITDVYVTINLWWKDLYEAANVRAYFASDNVASFSTDQDDVILTGKLYFTRDAEQIRENIMLEITRSDVKEIPVGTLTFTKRHDDPWFEPILEYSYDDTSNDEYWEEGDLILPESASKKLKEEDIKDLSLEETEYAIAEIYARHECKFEDEALQAYFDSKWWYEGYIEWKDFSEDVFSDVEKSNLKLLQQHEASLTGAQNDAKADAADTQNGKAAGQ